MICSSSMRCSSRGTPGREEEARLADVEREAAGGADRIVEQLGAGGQHGLLAVVGRHHAAAPAEELLHPAEPFLAEDELDAGGLGRDLLRQIVDRGAQPAVDDDRVGALARRAGTPAAGVSRSSPTVVPHWTASPTSPSFWLM